MVFLLRLPDLGPLFFGSGPADRRRAQTVPRKTARASILPPGRVEELSRHNETVEKVLLTESRVPDRPLLVDHTGSNGRQRSITHPNRYYEGLFVVCPLELKREFDQLDLTEGERNESDWNNPSRKAYGRSERAVHGLRTG